VLDLEIEKGVYRGLGLARYHGQVLFVPHVLPGERVRARVQRIARGYAEMRLVEVVSPAPARRSPPCPYAPRCGGCAHQEVDYAAQLTLKEAVLQETLGRSRVEWSAPIPVQPSPEQAWRTRASFHLGMAAEGLRLGLFEEGTHRVVDVETCLQVSPAMNRAARGLLEALRPRPRLASLIQGIELAESSDGAQLVAALVVAGDPGAASDASALVSEVPWLTGLGLATERGPASEFVLLKGAPYVETTVDGVAFRAHVRSFFQGNRFLLEPLARAAVAPLPAEGKVLDLYSGVGLFALLAARGGRPVRSAEMHPLAVEDARVNAKRAGLEVRIDAAEVRAALAAWPVEAGESIVLDPPRSGVEAPVLEAIAARAPGTIVYVSCDPPTLGRDLARLVAKGYRIESLQAFDLFPDTFHLETIAVLRG
jgi:23S rRNA (uracil1939-C5)-methyltransferase